MASLVQDGTIHNRIFGFTLLFYNGKKCPLVGRLYSCQCFVFFVCSGIRTTPVSSSSCTLSYLTFLLLKLPGEVVGRVITLEQVLLHATQTNPFQKYCTDVIEHEKLQKDVIVTDRRLAEHFQWVLSVCSYAPHTHDCSYLHLCISGERSPVGKKAGCCSCAFASACW